jgi:predicted transcriptional regulator
MQPLDLMHSLAQRCADAKVPARLSPQADDVVPPYPAPYLPHMHTAKQEAAALIASLADDVSIEEIQYRLHVLRRIREGLEDVEAGRVVSHEEVEADLARWLGG